MIIKNNKLIFNEIISTYGKINECINYDEENGKFIISNHNIIVGGKLLHGK